MNERLIAFLQAEELSSGRFADLMQIQRSGVSHLLSGRNKPGYDFFEKFLRKFPAVNIEWLISGKGKMYKEQPNVQAVAPPQPVKPQPKIDEPDLFSAQPASLDADAVIERKPQAAEATTIKDNCSGTTAVIANVDKQPIAHNERHIKKLIILYSDGSFEEKG
jgi:hypothetical protein